MQHTWLDKPSHGDLPAYLSEPPPSEPRRSLREWRDDLARTLPRAAGTAQPAGTPSVPFGGSAHRLSPTFSRMVALRRDLLPAALDAWWGAGENAGSVRVHRRLKLERPEGNASAGWRMQGRVRRLTVLHWIPVVVELWPIYDEFTMMTMTPQRSVLTSRRYFRVGHAVLDRLWQDLASRTARSGGA